MTSRNTARQAHRFTSYSSPVILIVAALALAAGCSKKPAEAPADRAAAAPAMATEQVVNVYNWSDYIDASILEKLHSQATSMRTLARSSSTRGVGPGTSRIR
jgi:spermidine/putrescine-binding protein